MTCLSLGLGQNRRLAQAREISASLEPWPRAESTPHPSLGLERNQRLAQALASSAISALPELRSRC